MRMVCGLAIAFWLVFTAWAQDSPQQEPVGSTSANKEAPAAPAKAVKKRRKQAAPAAPDAPRKIVVREGGAREPASQIVPGMTPEEANRQRQDAVKWLGSTDNELRQLAGRTLDTRQLDTVGQIHSYMEGARSALKEGDVGRANTLAQKAHLLAEDLAKH